jgi:excisionase family DNA binding protein
MTNILDITQSPSWTPKTNVLRPRRGRGPDRIKEGADKIRGLFRGRKDLVTVREAADILGIPLTTVYYLVHRRTLESFKMGGQWRLDRRRVEVYGSKLRSCDSWVSVRDVAGRLGIPVSTVYHHVRSGRLPAVRVGGRWRITEDQLASVLAFSSP